MTVIRSWIHLHCCQTNFLLRCYFFLNQIQNFLKDYSCYCYCLQSLIPAMSSVCCFPTMIWCYLDCYKTDYCFAASDFSIRDCNSQIEYVTYW